MKLYSLLTEEQIRLGLESDSLEAAIREMLLPVKKRLKPVGLDRVEGILLERERNLSTMIVEGICIPHARIEGLKDFVLAIGASPKGIPPAEGASSLVHLIFVILTPPTKNTLMLQTLAAVARLVSSPKTRQALVNVKTPAKVLKIIEESGVDVKKTLCANDIMRPVEASVERQTPLTRAMELLLNLPDEGIPVVGPAGELVGELAASDIIAVGLPRYMDLMDDPAPLGNIEPFEQFFKKERYLKVDDLAREEILAVEPETPVVQIAHLMIANEKSRAYVVRESKLVGVIYRKDIVTRVLML
jgi:PTS system nitrogen regulatory IIA component